MPHGLALRPIRWGSPLKIKDRKLKSALHNIYLSGESRINIWGVKLNIIF